MKGILLFILLTLNVAIVMADAIGSWKLYPCYNNVTDIQPAGDKVYVLASGNLYSYNNHDTSLQEYNKTTGLSSSEITDIAWVQNVKVLVIAYSDCKIDMLYENGEVTSINDYADKTMTGTKTVNDIYVSGQYVYISTGFGIIKLDVKNEYIVDTYNLGYNVNYCYISGNRIYAASSTEGLMESDMTSNLLDKNNWTNVGEYTPKTKEQYVLDTHNNCYWAADADSKLTKYQKQEDGTFVAVSTGVKPDGPIKNRFWRLYKHDGKIFCTPGIFAAGMNPIEDGCVQYYDCTNKKWFRLPDPSESFLGTKYRIMNCMAFDSQDKSHFWVGGYSGLYEYKDYIAVAGYNSTNSSLLPVSNEDVSGALITSMSYDKNQDLWIGNGWCDVALHCYKSDGTWTSYPQEGYNYKKLNTIDEQGMMYSTVTNSVLWIHSYSEKSALHSTSDNGITINNCEKFVFDDGSIANLTYIYGQAEDKDGNLWLATSSGPVYMTKEQRVAHGNILVRHRVPRNDGTNLADYLLNDISTRVIRIDATNRKWVGTDGNGVYLISADNNTQIYHFTVENSHLISNIVYDILTDNETGIVYFATPGGLCSFTADVTNDNSSDSEMTRDNVYAYPNPVTPDFTGYITIVGLTTGAQLKIMTSSGQLVHSGTCSGGSYQWNGCDTQGRKVASGIYMVNIATSSGEKAVVTKIAVVR